MLHRLELRFECGHRTFLRKPNSERLVVRVLRLAKCLTCNPDQYKEVCGGCHLPLSAVGHHSEGLCNTCVVREFRYARHAPVTITAPLVPLDHA